MKMTRDNQKSLADIALRILARGICAVSVFDKRVTADIAALGDGFSFAICAGIGEASPSVKLKAENGRFARGDSDIDGAELVIRFKDVSGVVPVLTGKMSVETAFAQHRMLIWGNMVKAVILVRIINITEAYLFPGFIIKKAMRKVPKKRVPRLFVYILMLFAGASGKPPQETAVENAEETADETVREAVDETAFDNGDIEYTEASEAVKEMEAAK